MTKKQIIAVLTTFIIILVTVWVADYKNLIDLDAYVPGSHEQAQTSVQIEAADGSQKALPSKVGPMEVEDHSDPVAWVHSVAEEAGLTIDVPVEVTNEGNCGRGCTSVLFNANGEIVDVLWIKIDPKIIGTDFGKFVVLHELGHASGIVEECGADDFAYAHGANTKYEDYFCGKSRDR